MKGYEVKHISPRQCEPYILGIHYAKRTPSITHSYGLFRGGEMCGIVTYGTPSSSPLRAGIAGDDYKEDILELNRLCLKDNLKNEASHLVSNSIKLLPEKKIIVSFADTEQGHSGYVYQACNFMYSGLSAKRTDWKVKGLEHLHGQTIADEFRGVENRANAMREKYGDDFYLEERSRKHRYLLFHGPKKWAKHAKRTCLYPFSDYPKGDVKYFKEPVVSAESLQVDMF